MAEAQEPRPTPTRADAASVIATARAGGLTLGTAESLTGGGVAQALTGIAGASSVFRGGIVAYAGAVKATVLGVPADLLAERGAVDPQIALAMAAGARRILACDLAVATTGVAGPDGSDGKAVGTVFVAVSTPSGSRVCELALSGSRAQIRSDSVAAALQQLQRSLDAEPPLRSAAGPGEYLSSSEERNERECR